MRPRSVYMYIIFYLVFAYADCGVGGWGGGVKEMFYLTITQHIFIYDYMVSDIVKVHSDSER